MMKERRRCMTFDEYQKKALKTDLFKGKDKNIRSDGFIEKLLGLIGETGEVAEKFKKIYRDEGGQISADKKTELTKELGDILWYIASVSEYLDIKLDDIAQANIEKLASRQNRSKLHGSGDNR